MPAKKEEKLTIAQALVEVRKEVTYLEKTAQSHKYKYVDETSILAAIRPRMDELGILIVPNILEHGTVQAGNQWVVTLKMQFAIIMGDETLVVDWFGCGQDPDCAKAFGKALTYTIRYFLLKLNNVPTDEDDPDAFTKKVEAAKPRQREQRDAPVWKELTECMLVNKGLYVAVKKELGMTEVWTISEAAAIRDAFKAQLDKSNE